jgi:hypothetical protein
MSIGQRAKNGIGRLNRTMKSENSHFQEGMMVSIFLNYERLYTGTGHPGLIIEIFPLLQIANILLTDGTIKKRVPFTNIKILNEDGI